MSDETDGGPILSEPIVIQTAFVNGVSVEATDGHIRLVGWEDLPRMRERRVAVRAALTSGAAESLWEQLGIILGKVKGH